MDCLELLGNPSASAQSLDTRTPICMFRNMDLYVARRIRRMLPITAILEHDLVTYNSVTTIAFNVLARRSNSVNLLLCCMSWDQGTEDKDSSCRKNCPRCYRNVLAIPNTP